MPDKSKLSYEAYCEFIRGENLNPASEEDWIAFNRAVDKQSETVIHLDDVE